MTWVLLIAYGAGYLWCFRFVVGYLIDDLGYSALDNPPDLADVVFSFFLGVLFTLFWPVLVLGRLAQRWYYTRDARSLAFFRPPSPIETPAQRVHRLERERDDRDRRIAELEAELGIDQTACETPRRSLKGFVTRRSA